MIKIIADSGCDITKFPGINFTQIPLTISTEEREYIDDETLDCHEMLDYLASYKSRSYTACPATDSWMEAFSGADEIYVVTLTSGLSGSYNSARIAADLYQSTHPDVKITVFDSLSTGPEMYMVLERIAELVAEEKPMEEIKEIIHKYIESVRLFFAFASLHNLAQNGRVHKALASAIGVLGIRVLGTASGEGTITPIGKCRGEKRVIRKLFDDMIAAGYCGGKVRICHVENQNLAEAFTAHIHETYPDAEVLFYSAGGICSYYGERGAIIIGCEC